MDTLDKAALDALLSVAFAPPNISERNGHSVRGDKLNEGWPMPIGKPTPPTYLYVTMLGINNNGQIVVRKKEGDLNGADVRDKEIEFARDLASGGGDQLDLTDFEFKRPTWFTIILNIKDWEFYYPQPDVEYPTFKKNHDPIVFSFDKVYFTNNNEIIISRSPNHSFYNCRQIYIPVPVSGVDVQRDAIRCINFFRKNDKGEPIEHDDPDTQRYTFNIFVRAPLVQNGKKVIIVIDPDGTNQGPIP